MQERNDGGGGTSSGGGPLQWIQTHPLLAVAIVAAAIVGVVLLRKKAPAASTATSSTATGDLSGLATDANGNHIVYLPVNDYFNNISTVTDSYNPVSTATTTTTVTAVPPDQPAPRPVPVVPPPWHGAPIPSPTPVKLTPVPTPVHAPIIVKPPPAKSTKGQWISTYRVVAGDTLSRIASRFNTTWPELYGHNRGTVDSTSQAHGNPIAGGFFNNIFPGEVLSVPSLN